MELGKYIIIICLLLGGCNRKHDTSEKPGPDFLSLMCNSLPAWKHVQTKEDFENLAFFKEVYEKNITYLENPPATYKIPKVIHFIWVGPKPFPRESIENVRSWIAHHPDWKIKFWTDRERPLPHPEMEICFIRDFSFKYLETLYNNSDNYGEKSDLLRLEILDQEGGIYADHDVACVNSFDKLNRAFNLYCGMEVPYPTTLSSSVLPTNNLVGASPGHPLLKKCVVWLKENWDQIEKDYPGKDRDAVINRVSHRTFCVLGETFKKHANEEGNIDIALPTCYFNSPKIEWALYSQHQYKGSWFENESTFEKNARKRLMMLSKKTNKLLLAVGVLAGLNLLGFATLLTVFLRMRTSH